MSEPLLVLGAELQAAVSLALSRPDLRFLFVSEQDVVDGWDLDNVEIRRASRESFRPSGSLNNVIVLNPKWLLFASSAMPSRLRCSTFGYSRAR